MRRHVEIRPGVEMPVVGFGVYQIPEGPKAEQAVGWALEAGYRHIDTAQGYGNEGSVGRALRAGGLPREQVFITTKFDTSLESPDSELERSLGRLGLDQVDLYLVHTPRGGPRTSWPGMERALERGLTRSIGVSNFAAGELADLLQACSVRPAVNQVQFSPFQYRRALQGFCASHGILLEAYSPLTRAQDLDHPVVAEIAAGVGRTRAQVLLRWGLQRGAVVIPKSSHRERIRENLAVFDFALDEGDLQRLDALDRTGGTSRALERPWWTFRGRMRRVARTASRRLSR